MTFDPSQLASQMSVLTSFHLGIVIAHLDANDVFPTMKWFEVIFSRRTTLRCPGSPVWQVTDLESKNRKPLLSRAFIEERRQSFCSEVWEGVRGGTNHLRAMKMMKHLHSCQSNLKLHLFIETQLKDKK